MTIDKDTFRDIPQYEGLYEINPEGIVRSKDREVTDRNGNKKNLRGRVLRSSLTPLKLVRYSLSKDNVCSAYIRETLIYVTFPELNSRINDLEGEIWLPLDNHPHYMLSNKGRIKRISFQRKAGIIAYMCAERLYDSIWVQGDRKYVTLYTKHEKGSRRRETGKDIVNAFYKTHIGTLPAKTHAILIDGDMTNICKENFRLSPWA